MPLGKKQKPGEPFDPLAQTVVKQGESEMARYQRGRRNFRLEQARFMAQHLGLTEQGRIPEEETAHLQSPKQRDEYEDQFRLGFDEATPEVITALESLIDRYGLPLERLDSKIAAFIFRRVMIEYRHMPLLQRAERKALFTPEELVALMRVLRVNQHQMADLMVPDATPERRYQTYVMIQRWVHGVNKPTGLLALRVNRMIENQVRRHTKGGTKVEGRPEPEEALSQKPESVERRARRRRQVATTMEIPLSSAARKAKEQADATER